MVSIKKVDAPPARAGRKGSVDYVTIIAAAKDSPAQWLEATFEDRSPAQVEAAAQQLRKKCPLLQVAVRKGVLHVCYPQTEPSKTAPKK